MAISLVKGQKVDLTKGNPNLNNVLVGLGWDPIKKFGMRTIDCDASAIMLDENDKIRGNENVIYFGNLSSRCGSVVHTGDNLTGDGDGDDEQILVDLSRVPQNVHKIVFVVNIYDCKSRRQDFGMIKNAFIRVANKQSREELIRFNLSDDYNSKTALILGQLYRHNGEWKFNALGEGTTDEKLKDLLLRYK